MEFFSEQKWQKSTNRNEGKNKKPEKPGAGSKQ